jgi:uroporphyrin-III C-methyltransferase
MSGLVSLVGAGPGDPELLTLRAADRLRRADLVLYDALATPALLELAATAKRFFVGKRAGRHSITQAAIHTLMIRAAKRGERVVRLKCGDPFVLGRGGEEALALAAAGIAYEVVPGVSSAIAAPALAGIPVTQRGIAAGFAAISGHDGGVLLDSIAPGALTLVILMGITARAAIAARLIAHGWPASTPAAVVLGASHADSSRWLGTLTTLGDAPIDSDLAGVIVVGEVVALAPQIVAEHALSLARSS